MKARILLTVFTILTVFITINLQTVSAEIFDCTVNINPVNPTNIDNIEAEVSFFFRTCPPFANFSSSVARRDNVFSTNVIIFDPKDDELVTQIVHTDRHNYDLGLLESGCYVFEVTVKTFHGSDESWVERIEFDVYPSAVTPELPSYIAILLILMLSSLSIMLGKKLRRNGMNI